MKLQEELLELSKKVQDFYTINNIVELNTSIELSEGVDVPYTFTCEALHPGTYKGVTIEEEEIKKAINSIFMEYDNFHNYEINRDHKNSRKQDSSISDLLGKVIEAKYDDSKKAYILTGKVYDKGIAKKISDKVYKYVSLRIFPGKLEKKNGKIYAKNLEFQELSFVRKPGDPKAKIY